MNKLVENTYVSHNLWGWINKKFKRIKRINSKYLVLPLIYIFVILLVVPTTNVIINRVSITRQDSYTTIVITKEDKIAYILDKYNLTNEQFKVLNAIVLSEAEFNSYEDAYAVINTIYNRTHSKNWVASGNKYFGNNKGENLYYQAIMPNQFVVYQNGTYKKYLNTTDSIGNDAIIDFLYTEDIMHDYLSFRSSYIKISGSVAFSENGNNYFNKLKEENHI